jgi:hypothetical protein
MQDVLRLWPRDAPGKRVKRGGPDSRDPWRTVVGVVGSVKQYGLEIDGRMVTYSGIEPDHQDQTGVPGRAARRRFSLIKPGTVKRDNSDNKPGLTRL